MTNLVQKCGKRDGRHTSDGRDPISRPQTRRIRAPPDQSGEKLRGYLLLMKEHLGITHVTKTPSRRHAKPMQP